MVFDSIVFVIFFAIVLALYFGAKLSWTARKAMLLVASYIFYMAWNPLFALLLVFSTLVDWYTARAIANAEDPRRRKTFLLISLTSNLGLLAIFKYSMFFAKSTITGLNAMGMSLAEPTFSIVLPVGISFYTFQTLSYTIDIYRGSLKPAKNPLDFALFVSFFPQLVAGPIVRAADFIPQMDDPKPYDRKEVGWGISLMILGLFEKIALADMLLAPIADNVYNTPGPFNFTDAWFGTLAFTGQIFFDFAGYSTCAIGAALCLGFKLPDNFKFPYASRGFSDFWRRWHISLSTWLRDYLYISLGGNRHGTVRTYFNLSMTMLLGGLWHGASWAFIVWGALHGTYLVVERLCRPLIERATWTHNMAGRFVAWAFTLVAVMYAWVFFRATSFSTAWEIVKSMSGVATPGPKLVTTFNMLVVALCLGGLIGAHQYMRDKSLRDVADRAPTWLVTLVLLLMTLGILFSRGDERAFIYFQF